MYIKNLRLQGYRNIDNIDINPSRGINVICGDNAQGKTNLLEGIWLFTGCRSFRGTRDCELVGFDKGFARAEMCFYSGGREQSAGIVIETCRQAKLNGVSLTSASRLMGEFLAVIFSPAHLSLIQDGPSERRKFLDMALCQTDRRYAKALSEYNRVLLQRNSLLKDIPGHSELLDTLDVWDEALAKAGAFILEERIKYAEKLKDIAGGIYSGLSSSKEELSLYYKRKLPEGLPQSSEPAETLKKSRREDILNGGTSYGIHRDDLTVNIDGISAREFGSQGQQRSGALALKLSEARIIKDITGEEPVVLLDDVMSELDASRQDYILNHIKGRQVFITCCDPPAGKRINEGNVYEIKKGSLV